MKKSDMHQETFSRFISTVTMQLRGSRDIVSGLWITGIAILAKCMAESARPGQDRIQAALTDFLASAPEMLMPAFDDLLKAMSQDDDELKEAIKVLSGQWTGRLAPSDLGIVRNALAHAQLPDLADPEIRIALGDAFRGRILGQRSREEGEYLVPSSIGQLVTQLAQPGPAEIVQVPFSGLGSLMVEAYRQSPARFSVDGPVKLVGVEPNTGTWARGVLVLRLYGIPGASTKTTVTMAEAGETANVVMSCPPFSNYAIGRSDIARMTVGRSDIARMTVGRPGTGSADKEAIQAMRFAIPKIAEDMPDQALRDFAGVFQIVQALGPEGRAVVVVHPGLLFRVGAVARLRSAWVDEDLVEAVISLPAGLMHNTAMATNIVIFNTNKAADRRGQVLFIAADEMGRTKGSKKLDVDLFHHEMAKIVSAYQAFKDVPGLAKVIDGFELGDQDWNLIPARYVVRDEELESGPDLKALHASLAVAEGQAAQARTRLDQTIQQLLTSL
jgi:type I restriction enzyme M protein